MFWCRWAAISRRIPGCWRRRYGACSRASASACDLGASGYANSFYSAAVQAGSTSWKAFFFGSL
ncbi:hypothetical protein AB0N19_38630, partial [Streptomyces sp. NPDC051132]|uniref:hypothetical protein n=1 Tax=Streptomyces sp. NPDC051132 TaxID=3155667 RepID=UPI0034397F64